MRLEVLRWLAVVQAVTTVILVGALVGHAAWSGGHNRRWRGRRELAATRLAHLIVGHGDVDPTAAAVGALPTGMQLELLGGLVRSLGGAQRAQVTAVARAVGLTARAERWCGSRRRLTRLRGTRLHASAGTVPERLTHLLEDPWPPVRAEAAALVCAEPTPERLHRLLTMLADPAALVRFAAQDALCRCGGDAAGTLLTWLVADGVDGRTVADALDVAVPLAGPQFTPVVHRHRDHPEARVRARVAALAAHIGGHDSADLLLGYLDDPDPEVRASAAAGLDRLGYWPAAPRLARVLRDPAWLARRAAGLALRHLDAPGALMLHRSLDDPDAFARDMARQVLDLPDTRAAG